MSHHSHTAAAILAAGLGTRMGSDLPKALVNLGGRPIAQYVVGAVAGAGVDDIVVVVGHQAEMVREALGDGVRYAVQERPRGTADALLCAREALRDFSGCLLTVYCDIPLVPPHMLRRLAGECAAQGVAAALVTVELQQPGAYGRIMRGADGRVVGIKEAAGATPAELAIKEINAGIYCFQAPLIFDVVAEIEPDPTKGEYCLTDAVGILAARGRAITVIRAQDPTLVMGVNTPQELERAERTLRGMSS